ncbi:unnamed protein product [Brachionus calyciflorus]|uniref:Uncharacterized protein n=1 Tax=Brachionus calyciflorus TaxID=104777 RepID=A0A813XK96_9BILA|nr:unnamed protein product [Brachionus calyciflorus]
MYNQSKMIKLVSFVSLIAACSILGLVKNVTKRSLNELHQQIGSDKPLLNDSFCKQPTVHEFPNDIIPFKEFKYSRLIIHSLIIVYLLAAVSIICDDFFVESLNRLSSGNFYIIKF